MVITIANSECKKGDDSLHIDLAVCGKYLNVAECVSVLSLKNVIWRCSADILCRSDCTSSHAGIVARSGRLVDKTAPRAAACRTRRSDQHAARECWVRAAASEEHHTAVAGVCYGLCHWARLAEWACHAETAGRCCCWHWHCYAEAVAETEWWISRYTAVSCRQNVSHVTGVYVHPCICMLYRALRIINSCKERSAMVRAG